MSEIMAEIETKAEARKRNRKELAHKGIKLGLRKLKSAKLSKSIEERKQAICMCCHNPAHSCICSGHMSEAAMNRYFEEGKKKS